MGLGIYGEINAKGSRTGGEVAHYRTRPIGVQPEPLLTINRYAFAAQRKAIQRTGLPQVRSYRLNFLIQEEQNFQAEGLAQCSASRGTANRRTGAAETTSPPRPHSSSLGNGDDRLSVLGGCGELHRPLFKAPEIRGPRRTSSGGCGSSTWSGRRYPGRPAARCVPTLTGACSAKWGQKEFTARGYL